jgi:bacillithiol biosynthesis cysteine-adding enzyme BshC
VPVGAQAIQDLSRALHGLPHAEFALGAAAAAYQPSACFGSAFRELMRRLLPDSGMLFVDPLDPALRRLAAPFLAEALSRSADLVRLLIERNRELDAAGYHAQVRVDRDSTLFFLLREGRRLPLRSSSDGFLAGGQKFSLNALTADAAALSPNALLRPVLQDYLLPTVAFVGGPAEIAYLAQSQVLYQQLLGRMPVVAPRAGFTVLDEPSADLAERYGLSLADLLAGEEYVQQRIAAALIPPELEQRLQRARGEIEDSLQRLRLALANFDSTLAAALDTSRRKILYQLWKIERKASSEAFRRNVRAARHTERLLNLAAPHRHLQERFYCILGLLARFGPALPDALLRELDLSCPDHRMLVL